MPHILSFPVSFATTSAIAGTKGANVVAKIQVGDSCPDDKVRVVKSIPDLRVQLLNSFPTSQRIGKW